MKNMFIVEVESREGTSAKSLSEAFARGWNLGEQWRQRPALKVEEYDYKKIVGFISDYIAAVDTLDEYESKHNIYSKCSINSPIGQSWKRLYDEVTLKKAALVNTLRVHGCSV